MRIHIDIDVKLPRWAKVTLWSGGVLALAVLPVAVAYASYPYVPQDGGVVSASGLQSDFDNFDTRLNSLEEAGAPIASGNVISVNGQKLSTAAVFKGVTTATTPGDMSGLTASGTGLVKAANACNATLSS